ncbi:hypothetical protein TVAG_431160 [Trichomonas vaginalis G3]|uniref:Uncharacterized protein n=1 Tax=Trichomonas vaginalis (strain ATCC PRA-98 / G3) TaxID=412133 RepID=A2EZF4_TRIV3|nr:hypothetical protein TVAGG3_0587780 [Trichomonas vaginalis G3]EAY01975.1 hypothetical protein TVAG_431160 [Trichomonas vaginalis G3]KAI5523019.1 hypothetical protein TVAGG3_0587780 [Trichomonas vaginalis G3]|eukprot:XP_001330816.1 hypothetical protein [Trichomonas vaginalis G3]
MNDSIEYRAIDIAITRGVSRNSPFVQYCWNTKKFPLIIEYCKKQISTTTNTVERQNYLMLILYMFFEKQECITNHIDSLYEILTKYSDEFLDINCYYVLKDTIQKIIDSGVKFGEGIDFTQSKIGPAIILSSILHSNTSSSIIFDEIFNQISSKQYLTNADFIALCFAMQEIKYIDVNQDTYKSYLKFIQKCSDLINFKLHSTNLIDCYTALKYITHLLQFIGEDDLMEILSLFLVQIIHYENEDVTSVGLITTMMMALPPKIKVFPADQQITAFSKYIFTDLNSIIIDKQIKEFINKRTDCVSTLIGSSKAMDPKKRCLFICANTLLCDSLPFVKYCFETVLTNKKGPKQSESQNIFKKRLEDETSHIIQHMTPFFDLNKDENCFSFVLSCFFELITEQKEYYPKMFESLNSVISHLSKFPYLVLEKYITKSNLIKEKETHIEFWKFFDKNFDKISNDKKEKPALITNNYLFLFLMNCLKYCNFVSDEVKQYILRTLQIVYEFDFVNTNLTCKDILMLTRSHTNILEEYLENEIKKDEFSGYQPIASCFVDSAATSIKDNKLFKAAFNSVQSLSPENGGKIFLNFFLSLFYQNSKLCSKIIYDYSKDLIDRSFFFKKPEQEILLLEVIGSIINQVEDIDEDEFSLIQKGFSYLIYHGDLYENMSNNLKSCYGFLTTQHMIDMKLSEACSKSIHLSQYYDLILKTCQKTDKILPDLIKSYLEFIRDDEDADVERFVTYIHQYTNDYSLVGNLILENLGKYNPKCTLICLTKLIQLYELTDVAKLHDTFINVFFVVVDLLSNHQKDKKVAISFIDTFCQREVPFNENITVYIRDSILDTDIVKLMDQITKRNLTMNEAIVYKSILAKERKIVLPQDFYSAIFRIEQISNRNIEVKFVKAVVNFFCNNYDNCFRGSLPMKDYFEYIATIYANAFMINHDFFHHLAEFISKNYVSKDETFFKSILEFTKIVDQLPCGHNLIYKDIYYISIAMSSNCDLAYDSCLIDNFIEFSDIMRNDLKEPMFFIILRNELSLLQKNLSKPNQKIFDLLVDSLNDNLFTDKREIIDILWQFDLDFLSENCKKYMHNDMSKDFYKESTNSIKLKYIKLCNDFGVKKEMSKLIVSSFKDEGWHCMKHRCIDLNEKDFLPIDEALLESAADNEEAFTCLKHELDCNEIDEIVDKILKNNLLFGSKQQIFMKLVDLKAPKWILAFAKNQEFISVEKSEEFIFDAAKQLSQDPSFSDLIIQMISD